MTPIEEYRAAWKLHELDAMEAYGIFVSHCRYVKPIRVPGMDTPLRLAYRIYRGKSAVESAALEYIYRWRLALQSRVFGIPHTIGLDGIND